MSRVPNKHTITRGTRAAQALMESEGLVHPACRCRPPPQVNPTPHFPGRGSPRRGGTPWERLKTGARETFWDKITTANT